MKLLFVLIASMLLAASLSGCAVLGGRPHQSPPALPADTTIAAAMPYDPLALGGDVFETAQIPSAPAAAAQASPVTEAPAIQTVEPAGQYRVLIASYLDQQNATDAGKTAGRILEVNVNIEYEAPFYLVVTGWLESKSAASELRTRAQNNGFGRATILQNSP